MKIQNHTQSLKHGFLTYLASTSLIALSGCQTLTPPSITPPKSTSAKQASIYHTHALRAQRIEAALQNLVDKGIVPGISMIMYEDGKEVFYAEKGYSDLAEKTPQSREDVARYFSMTKPIVGAALMTLYEDGRFKLDDPIAKYMPEYADTQVYVSVNADGSLKTAPVKRPITIRDIMRHTAGMTYGVFTDTPVDKAYRKANIFSNARTLAEFSKTMGALPLLNHPGEIWTYSLAVDVQGRLIEVLSGQTLGEYLTQTIFNPLNMTHTGFTVKAADAKRLASAYLLIMDNDKPELKLLTDENTQQMTVGSMHAINDEYLTPKTLQRGGSGLVSTIDDYANFLKMISSGGKANGKRILKPETIALMSKDHLGTIDNGTLEDDMGFGLNYSIKLRNSDGPKSIPVPIGTYSWGGLASTLFWVDPKNDIFVVVQTQVINMVNADIRKSIAKSVYIKDIK